MTASVDAHQAPFEGIAGIVGALLLDERGTIVGIDDGGVVDGVLHHACFALGASLPALAAEDGAPGLTRDVDAAFREALSRPGVRFESWTTRHRARVRLMGHATRLRTVGEPRIAVTLADVSQCHWYEQAQAGTQHLRSVLDAIPDLVAIHDRGTILEANRALEELVGVERAELIGRGVEPFVAPEQRADVMARADSSGRTRFRGDALSFNGIRRTFDVHGADCRFHGRQARVDVARDITACLEAEHALATSEARLRGLLEGGLDVVWESDAGGALTYVSPNVEAALGWRADDLVGRAVLDLLRPEEGDVERARLSAAAAGLAPMPPSARWARCRDGRERLMEGVATAVRDADGAVVGYRGVERDITQRHEAETLSSVLLSYAPDPLLVVEDSGVIVLANRRAGEVFGYDDNELVGLPVEVLLPGDLRASHVASRAEYARQPTVRYMGTSLDLEAVRRDSSRLPVDVSLSPVTLGTRRLTVAAVRDLTERRRVERSLRERDEQLRQAQKMEAIGRLAGGVAHDFNNLLTAILGHAEFLLEETPESDGRHEDLVEIRRAAESAASLTHQLLAFGRRQVLQPRLVDPSAIARDLERMLRRLIGENVGLELDLDPLAGAIHADPTQVQQIIVNLVINARDALPRGGRVTVQTRRLDLDEAEARRRDPLTAGRCVLLSVSDTGVGMDDATRARIFEPFFTTKTTGTGLGLATVHGIVAQSGGHIGVTSERGGGARFEAVFPFASGTPEAPQPAQATRVAGGNETILLVEDDVAVRGLEARVLRSAGFVVLEAARGEDAIDLAAGYEREIHLLITDVVMPGMNGREVSERVTTARPRVRTIYVSGYTDDILTRTGVLEPGVELLCKPFVGPELVSRVRSVLDRPSDDR